MLFRSTLTPTAFGSGGGNGFTAQQNAGTFGASSPVGSWANTSLSPSDLAPNQNANAYFIAFAVTNTAVGPVRVTSLSYDLRQLTGAYSGADIAGAIGYGVSSSTTTPTFQFADSGVRVTPGNSSTVTFNFGVGSLPAVTLAQNDRLQVRILLRSTTKNASGQIGTRSITFDNITLNGDVVPEPASLAVFGLLGAGLVAKRFRRKQSA